MEPSTEADPSSFGDGNGRDSPTMEQVKKAADEYNKIGAVAAKAGIQQGLHNQGFELSMVDGKRTFVVRFARSEAGQVPVPDVDHHGRPHRSRVLLEVPGPLHLNAPAGPEHERPGHDSAANTRGAGWGRRDRGRRPQVTVGKGSIDWVKTFTAAKTGGVKNYFVEQNWELTQQSVAYRKTLKV